MGSVPWRVFAALVVTVVPAAVQVPLVVVCGLYFAAYLLMSVYLFGVWTSASAGLAVKGAALVCSVLLLLAMPNPWAESGLIVDIPLYTVVPPLCVVGLWIVDGLRRFDAKLAA